MLTPLLMSFYNLYLFIHEWQSDKPSIDPFKGSILPRYQLDHNSVKVVDYPPICSKTSLEHMSVLFTSLQDQASPSKEGIISSK